MSNGRRVSHAQAGALLDFGGRRDAGALSRQLIDSQLDGAVAAHNLLQERGVAYIADEVGTGKTLIAAGVLALLRHDDPSMRALVIAPRANLQEKWRRELRSFARENVRFSDLRVRAIDGEPARPLRTPGRLSDVLETWAEEPHCDLICRLSSFQLGHRQARRTEYADLWRGPLAAKGSAKVSRLLDRAVKSSDDLDIKETIAACANRLLPHIGVLVVDEAHNLKGGVQGGAARNRVLWTLLGHNPRFRGVVPGYGTRIDRVLMLSATPMEDKSEQLLAQLKVLGVEDRVPDLSAEDEGIRLASLHTFLFRRLTKMRVADQVLTRNRYREEWRAGGTTSPGAPLPLSDVRARLTFAVVQKKVADVLNNGGGGRQFQIGMLTSFESLAESASNRARWKARATAVDTENQQFFDDSVQNQLASDEERRGIDSTGIMQLVASHHDVFGRAPAHPKMDAVVDRLVARAQQGRKTLVFTRRVASVDELVQRVNDRIDADLEIRLRAELPGMAPDLDRLIERYREVTTGGSTDEDEAGSAAKVVSDVGAAAEDADLTDDQAPAERRIDESPDEAGTEVTDHVRGGRSLFAWLFREGAPDGLLTGRVLRQRLEQGGYVTLLRDNYVAAVLGCEPMEVPARLCAATSDEDAMVKVDELAQRHLGAAVEVATGTRFLAAQLAGLQVLADHGSGEVRDRAVSALTAVALTAPTRSLVRRRTISVSNQLRDDTLATALRADKELCRELWHESLPWEWGDEEGFRRREWRWRLLSAALRLDYPAIDLWLCEVRRNGSLTAIEGRLDAQALAADFLSALRRQRESTGERWTSYAALHALRLDADLVLEVNGVQPGDDAIPPWVGNRRPAVGMSGQVNGTAVKQFRTPTYPLVIISTDLLQEGEDLHTFCDEVHHYGIAWMPSSLEQRTGRVALAHAHGRGVYHRALCPSAVLIAGQARSLRVQVTNWHAGARVTAGDATGPLTGTAHVDALAAGDAALYRAPENAQALANPAPLDVFSLGCLVCTVFTGNPPAPTAGKLRELLATAGCVPVEAVGDGQEEMLAVFVAELTDADPGRRPVDFAGVLESLDAVEEDWTTPDPADDEPHVTLARSGATLLDGRFRLTGRLGLGSTAFALLVRDNDNGERVGVLKVAREPQLNPRLAAEATALAALDHPGIVKLLDGPLDIDGHSALLLSYAGDRDDVDRDLDPNGDSGRRHTRTLAARIGESFDAELTERFGEDLLEAVRHLEDRGVAHRDIKPENLGIAPQGRGDALHLVLFDFSLAGASIDRLDAGTPGYLDPFLRRPGRGRWDPAAERYAAAVVLHELCTGTKPIYGDGRADPGLVDAPVRLDKALFDASVAEGLVTFFARALAPEVADRHGTAVDMAWAWREAFRAGRQPSTQTDHPAEGDEPAPFELPAGTSSATSLAGLPLSARAVAALERLEILTVADLLGEPLNRLRQLRGVGAAVRNELVGAVAHLREALADNAELDDDAPLAAAARALISRTAPAGHVSILRAWLGLDGNEQWPNAGDLAADHGGPENVAEVIAGAKERWLRQVPVRVVRDWIADELGAMAGVASAEQLAARLARSRPAPDNELVAPEGEHDRAARAMVRAAISAEGERMNARWVRRVLGGPVVVALDHAGGPDGNRLADYAAALGACTGDLVSRGTDPIVGRAVLVATLRELVPPDGIRPLPDAALAELAASLCPLVAVNNRLELYHRGLPAAEALRAARRAFIAAERIAPADLIAKVAARFPAAEALPDRPDLDRLVAAAGLDLVWDAAKAAYLAPQPAGSSGSSGSLLTRHATSAPAPSVTPVEIDVAADFEDRLRRSIDSGGILVLVPRQRVLERCADELARLPITIVDLDEWLLAELRRLTDAGRPSWDLVVEVDAAGPASARWRNLTSVVDRALDSLTASLAATPGTVLLTRCGLLARYKRLDMVARWRDVVHDRSTALDALWLLVAAPGTTDVPILDGEAVPVITRNEWARIPDDWLRNSHRAVTTAAAHRPTAEESR